MDFKKRQTKLREKLNNLNLDGFITVNPTNTSYLTNFSGSTSIFILTLDKSYIITDFRYYTQVENECKNIELIKMGDLKDCTSRLVEFLPTLNLKRIGFESNITYNTHAAWKKMFTDLELIPTTDLVEDIAMIKEKEEVDMIRESLDITEKALVEILKTIKPGVTEKVMAAELEYLMRKSGSDKTSFDTIIASGWRSAIVHGAASDKVIQKDEFIVCDCGITKDGYCSDITRTIFLGNPDKQHEKIWNIVNLAKNEAIKKARPGFGLKDLDAVARDIIKAEGYSENFGHGLGHGVGQLVHTKPKVAQHAEGLLEPGMIITIEPGIYIKDFGGVRLEDLVLITETGCEVLNKLPSAMTYE